MVKYQGFLNLAVFKPKRWSIIGWFFEKGSAESRRHYCQNTTQKGHFYQLSLNFHNFYLLGYFSDAMQRDFVSTEFNSTFQILKVEQNMIENVHKRPNSRNISKFYFETVQSLSLLKTYLNTFLENWNKKL